MSKLKAKNKSLDINGYFAVVKKLVGTERSNSKGLLLAVSNLFVIFAEVDWNKKIKNLYDQIREVSLSSIENNKIFGWTAFSFTLNFLG